MTAGAARPESGPSLELLRAMLTIARSRQAPPEEIQLFEQAIVERTNGKGGSPIALPPAVLGATFLEMKHPEPRWLIPGLLLENSLGMLAGPPGSAKTFMAIRLAADVTAAGFDVLLVEEECSAWDLSRRLQAAKGDPRRLRVLHQSGARLDERPKRGSTTSSWMEHLRRESDGVALVILDPISNLHAMDDREQDAMQALWTIIQEEFQRQIGATVLPVGHTTKVSWGPTAPMLADIRGSGVIAGRLDFAYILKPLRPAKSEDEEADAEDDSDPTLFELHNVKMRTAEQQKPRVGRLGPVDIGNGSPAYALQWEEGLSPAKAKRDQRIASVDSKVLDFLRRSDYPTAKALTSEMHGRKSDILKAVREMLADGRIRRDPKGCLKPADELLEPSPESYSNGNGTRQSTAKVPGFPEVPTGFPEPDGKGAGRVPTRGDIYPGGIYPLGTCSSLPEESEASSEIGFPAETPKPLCLKCRSVEARADVVWCDSCWRGIVGGKT